MLENYFKVTVYCKDDKTYEHECYDFEEDFRCLSLATADGKFTEYPIRNVIKWDWERIRG